MQKIFSPADWQDLPGEDTQIKVASGGLTGQDKLDALRVASPEIVDWISKVATHPDNYYVHKFAMGGSNTYGPNRWGDGFRETVLRRDVPTFEIHGKAYRNHKSKGPYYGKVAAARFRDDLNCVELVTEYYGCPKTAAAGGGRVADLELTSLRTKGSIPVSMGSWVPGDSCVVCNNWSPTRDSYCTSVKEGGMCPLFGCKNGMLKVAEDGRLQHVDNPKNTFYDISMVQLGADPCANGFLLPMGKFASFDEESLADHWARESKIAAWSIEGSDLDTTTLNPLMVKLAYVLAEIELQQATLPCSELDGGYKVASYMDCTNLHASSPVKRAQAIRDLAAAKVFPNFRSYAKSAGLSDGMIDEMIPLVGSTFQTLRAQRQATRLIKLADFPKNLPTNFVNRLNSCNDFSLEQPTIVRRSLESAANERQFSVVRTAKVGSALPEIVVKYAAAKLAWLSEVQPVDMWHLVALQRRDLIL